MFIHRTRGVIDYINELGLIPSERLDAWDGESLVDSAAWV